MVTVYILVETVIQLEFFDEEKKVQKSSINVK